MDKKPTRGHLSRPLVDCMVRGPLPALLEIENVDLDAGLAGTNPPAFIYFDPFGPGCKLLELHFPTPTRLGEIQFVNFYTAAISIYVKTKGEWRASVVQWRLMKRPHSDEGSQDAVSLTERDSVVPWRDLSEVRLVLRQPSAEWVDFEIDRLVIYQDEPRHSHKNVLYLGQQLQEMDAAVALTRLNTDEALRSPTYEDCYEFKSCLSMD